MNNKIFRDYMDEKYNKEKNYKSILLKFKEMDNMQKSRKNKMKNIAAMFIMVILIGIISSQVYARIQWNIEFKEYQNREFEKGLGIIGDDGYTEKVDMDYIEQDGIKAKIDSLFITDDEFKAQISFEFDENITLNSETFNFGSAVYDEDNTIYLMNARVPCSKNLSKEIKKKTKYILKDIGANYKERDIFGNQLANQWATDRVESNGRKIVTQLNAKSIKGFPRSEKVFIRIFDLGYDMFDNTNMESESFIISDSEWIFEINVPEKFYERLTTNLKLKEDIPGVKISKLAVTESGLVITGVFEGVNDEIFQGMDLSAEEWVEKQNNLLYISDGEGNRYNNIGFGTYAGGKDSIHANFDVTKNVFEESGLYLNYTDSKGKLYTVELVKKN